LSIGIGFGAERLGLLALRFPRVATLCVAAMLLLISASVSRLSFDDDIHRVFLSDTPASQAQRAYEAEQSPPLSTALVYITSPKALDGTRTAMLLSVSVNTDQTTIAAAISNMTAELGRALPEGLSATLTGEDIISAEIVNGLKDDLISLNLWGALVITLAAFALLRDLRMALLAVVPALIGAAGVLALSVWLGYPITVLSNVIPILLLVLGVADGVHLTAHLKEHRSVRQAIETVGPACALTALTTAVAFASIMLTGNAQLFEFAVLGSVGTLLSFICVIVAFALLGRVTALSHTPIPKVSATFAQKLAALGAARPRATVATCIVILMAATWGFSQTKAWFPLHQNLPDGSVTLATNDDITDASVGATLLVATAFRSVRLLPVLVIPNTLPLMVTGATLHLWAQGQLSPTAVLALTIAFGIAIDDTVHFLSRFSHAKAKGATSAEAVTAAAKSAGQVMVLTTLFLTLGLSVTLLSDFTPIRFFGGMMIVTLWAAVLIDLLLLPALLTWKRTARVFV